MGNSKVNRLCHGFMHACTAPTVSLSTTRKTTPANTFHAACSAGSATSHTPHHSGGFSPPPPLPARRSEPDKSICHWPRPTHATLLLSYSPSSTAHAPRPPALTVSVKLTPEAGASCPLPVLVHPGCSSISLAPIQDPTSEYASALDFT
jgi:hypothetical protein